jgi:hypothetical protein
VRRHVVKRIVHTCRPFCVTRPPCPVRRMRMSTSIAFVAGLITRSNVVAISLGGRRSQTPSTPNRISFFGRVRNSGLASYPPVADLNEPGTNAS